MEARKKDRRDRRDAWFVQGQDAMHLFMPYLLPNRCDNEAVMIEHIGTEAIDAYLAEKNAENPAFRYTMFQVICAAIAKTIALRPKMNYFIAGKRMYERKEISFSFVVKKEFHDDAFESLAILRFDRDSDKSPIEQMHDKLEKIVHGVRHEHQIDGTNEAMGVLTSLPKPILSLVVSILNSLDRHGNMPNSLMREDPYYSSVFISNLGSIKMHASYHHLVNWGTNSFFAVINPKHKAPVFHDDGSNEMHEFVDLGLTIDERIADGMYFCNSIKVVKKLIEDPKLLELTLTAAIDL